MQLIPFTDNDFLSLYDFMQPIWLDTYSFLPKEQVLLLLDKYFSPDNLRAFQEKGYRYYKIDDVGVLVYVEKEQETYLDKLYLLPSARGKGYATFVFEQLLQLKKDITLNVNQSNQRAVACYQKHGFIIDQVIDIDLGNGMVNQDYIMRKAYK